MPAPTDAPMQWGTDATWTSGPAIGEDVVITPPAGVAEQGVVGGLPVIAEYINAVLNNHGRWLEWLRGDAGADEFGDGSDGDHTIVGTETLSRDMYYDNLTVPNGTILQTANFRVFVRNTFTKASGGIVRNNGGAGGAGANGVAGAAGVAVAAGSLGAGANGGLGGIIGAGAAGTTATDSIGGAGGAGGSSNDGGAGGAAGAATAPAATRGGYRHKAAALGASVGGTAWRGGGGGGGGGGGTSGTGGGGGAGAGIVVIWARVAVINGTGEIQANGGAGGAAYTGPDALGNGGGGGGGGGGIYLVVRELSGTFTMVANGGAGGADHLAGDVGVAGSAGFTLQLTA